ncbi:TRAP transporter small permease subunit [Leucothrix sargassi]|nr:TRAP transporter small permease subunit [Leucothrix sargassi]
MTKLLKIFAQICAVSGLLAILAGAGLTVINVGLRSIVGTSIYGVNDFVLLIVFVAVSASFPIAMRERQHMRITLLGDSLSKGKHIKKFDFLSGLFTLAFLVLLAMEFAKKAQKVTEYGSVSEIATIPLAPWWWCATIFVIGAALLQLEVVLKDLHASLNPPSKDSK